MAQTFVVESVNLIAQLAGKHDDARLCCERVDSFMKLLVGLRVAEEVGSLGKLAAFVSYCLQRCRRCGFHGYRARSQSRGESFNHFPKLKDLQDVFLGLTANHSAAVGMELNETFAGKSRQRLTDRAAADFEFSAQVASHKTLPRNEVPITNPLPDLGDGDVDHGLSIGADSTIAHRLRSPLPTVFMPSSIVGHLMKISEPVNIHALQALICPAVDSSRPQQYLLINLNKIYYED